MHPELGMHCQGDWSADEKVPGKISSLPFASTGLFVTSGCRSPGLRIFHRNSQEFTASVFDTMLNLPNGILVSGKRSLHLGSFISPV